VLFNSFEFLFLFLPVCYLVFWAIPSTMGRYAWLTASGYVFYAYWDPRFCLLMAFSTLVSFVSGLGFLAWQDERRRRLCLIIPITVDLLLLAFFKYADFALSIVGDVARSLGSAWSSPRLDIVLPVGISFYTFHTITYIVDAYRGVIRPTRNPLEFSTYVSLFPQLVAGPIVRFRQIEADLEHLGMANPRALLGRGISLLVVGLVEKVLVADTIAAFVDPALAGYRTLSSTGAWMAILGYTVQLYFDFSGYSTMAIGLGYLFGLRIPINFQSPYRALDPSDFWRRWHISLSTCLRDYLYIPLGGNRGSWALRFRNVMLTMLLGGLWHGAGWTFLVWGAYHGLLLCAFQAGAPHWNRLPRPIRWLTTFVLVVVGWVFFRSADLAMATELLGKMFVPTGGALVPQAPLSALALVGAGAWAVAGPNPLEMKHRWTPAWATFLAVALGACLAVLAGERPSPFLYFQF